MCVCVCIRVYMYNTNKIVVWKEETKNVKVESKTIEEKHKHIKKNEDIFFAMHIMKRYMKERRRKYPTSDT